MHEHGPTASADAGQGRRPACALEVADIFRVHGDSYRQKHPVTKAERQVMRAIETCRTAVLGGHLDVCDRCDFRRPSYNSCRNRHCPKCQSLRQAKWIAERQERTLPVHCFHVVFTVPAELKPLALRNQIVFYDLLFDAASQTLLTLGHDPKWLGARLGVTAVLHTWTRKLAFHPHLHCIVTGGGLAPDDQTWVPAKRRFLFPVMVIAALFRGKLLDGLARARARGKLFLQGVGDPDGGLHDDATFARFLDGLYGKKWVVYAKTPFAGPEQVFRYLGRYTHRVGLSNQRLLGMDDRGVHFITRGEQTCSLAPHEFIRRFLLHVLPRAFVKIRHFGLLAPANVKTRLAAAMRMLVAAVAAVADRPADDKVVPTPAAAAAADWRELFLRLTGIDFGRCPTCGQGTLVRFPLADFAGPAPPLLDTS